MEAQTLIDLIQNDKPKLRDWFYEFDRQSNSINDWQKLLGYPLETYSCQICHKIRNNITVGLSYWYDNNICKKPMRGNASGLGGRCPFFTLKVFGFKPCAGAFFSLISKVLKIVT